MMNQNGTKHELIAWSTHKLSPKYIGNNSEEIAEKEIPVEPEIVFFPEVKGLAVQGHPEWLGPKSQFVQYVLKLISEKLV